MKTELELDVFDPVLTPIGNLSQATCVIWKDRDSDVGTFEIRCPFTEDNKKLAKIDNHIHNGLREGSLGIIEFIEQNINERGEAVIDARGKLIKCILNNRVIYPMLNVKARVSDVMRAQINLCFISPTNSDRVESLLVLKENQEIFGEEISYQNTGGLVLDEQIKFASAYNLGFDVQFNFDTRKLEYVITQGVDRSIHQDLVPSIILSSDMEDIITPSFTNNKSDFKNVAIVAGAGEGSARKTLTIGAATGHERKEIFVDARDLSNVRDDGTTMSELEYNELLRQRGLSKLSEFIELKTFEAKIRVSGNTQYKYGVDYFKGDILTLQDLRIGISIDAKVEEVEDSWSAKGAYEMFITFGTIPNTLSQDVRRGRFS